MYSYHIEKIMLRGSSSVCSVTYIKVHPAHSEPTFSSHKNLQVQTKILFHLLKLHKQYTIQFGLMFL